MKLTPSSILGADCRALAEEMLTQPELLDGVFLDDKPEKLSVDDELKVLTVKHYTGVRSTTNEQRNLMVGALRLLGASDREIERTCGVTRRSIPLILRDLEKTGRVTPLKERLVVLVGDNAERSSLVLRRLLEDAMDGKTSVELAAMIKAVGQVNTFTVEKHQLLTGQATEIVEQRATVSRADIEDWLKDAATPIDVSAAPVESRSTGSNEIAGGFGADRGLVTSLEAGRRDGRLVFALPFTLPARLGCRAGGGVAGAGGRQPITG